MIIIAFLQLQPGIFSLSCHYLYGKYSKARASDLILFFILGVEVTSACLFLCSYYITNLFFFYQFRPETGVFAWIMVGIFTALALFSLFCYFRPGPGTSLFISRKAAKTLDSHARNIKSRSDAFVLGCFSGFYELVFTIPLYIVTSAEIMEMTVKFSPSHLLTLLYIIIPTLPLFIIRWKYRSGHNLANIQKSRVRDKNFVRFILSISYLSIAILIISFRILS